MQTDVAPSRPETAPEVTIHRLVQVDHIRILEPLLEEFHRRTPGLRYPFGETLSKIQQAVGMRDNFILVAYHEERGYLGYLWALASPNGELLIHQMLSKDLRAGRALTDSLMWCTDRLGATRWDALAVLEPGEASLILSQMKRFHIFAKRFQMVPHSIWLSRLIRRGGH